MVLSEYFAIGMGFFKKFENHLVAPKADLNLQLDDSYAALGEALEGCFGCFSS